MNPFSAAYGAVVAARNRLYDQGSLTSRRLRGPVVSIGNITAGGSGKTPFLIELGQQLAQHGIGYDVLSRGYRRQTKGVALVKPDGSPREYGDEPLLIACKLNVPVIVCEDRYAGGQFAEEKFGPQLHLLDDGFQHRQLARDFDIVLITPNDAHDQLLPAGRLREPRSSLARADAVVLTSASSTSGLPLAKQRIWRVQRVITVPANAESCVAFCGIGRPDNFFSDLRSVGIRVEATRAFRDHHVYSQADVQELLRQQKACGAVAFVTTEKDAINLRSFVSALQPLHVVPVRMRLENPEEVVSAILARVRERMQALA